MKSAAGDAGCRQNDIIGGRRRKANPVPPPDLNQRRELHGVENFIHGIAHRQNKAGDNCPSSRPAFIKVGELGRNSREAIMA